MPNNPLIRFVGSQNEREFEDVHPEVAGVIVNLAHHCAERGWPAPVVTSVTRTREENRDIYIPEGQRVFAKAARGETLTDDETRIVMEVRAIATVKKCSLEVAIAEWALRRESWHLYACAVDLRHWVWNAEQLAAVIAFLKSHAKNGKWEVLAHKVGKQGFHLHVAVKDEEWRKSHEDAGSGYRAS